MFVVRMLHNGDTVPKFLYSNFFFLLTLAVSLSQKRLIYSNKSIFYFIKDVSFEEKQCFTCFKPSIIKKLHYLVPY